MIAWTKLFFSIIYGLTILGMLYPTVMTLLPNEASKPNHLGYFSKCPFAPWSTLSLVGITLLLLGILHVIKTMSVN